MSEGKTPQEYLRLLKKLQKWLAINPHKQQLNADEAEAVQWAIDLIEGRAQEENKKE